MGQLFANEPPDRVPPRAPSRRGARPARASAERPLTVSEVAALVKDVLTRCAPAPLRVVGEVSNFSERTHWFFSLKDEAASLRCVCFASAARQVRFAPQDGMQVVVSGRLDFFPGQGHLQLYVDRMEPVGVGALELRLRQLMEELRQLGYFAEDRKKPLPLLPRNVAVVTSGKGAALQDVVNTARRRWAGCRLYLLDVRVQGADAAPEIAEAVAALSRHGQALGIDAIILTRGGGSLEDLWAFNERVVADAIHRCRLPVVAAIGHETDTTIAELVADRRASTPTQAAMMLIPDAAALRQQLDQMGGRLRLLLQRQTGQARQRLEGLARQPFLRRPDAVLPPLRRRVDELAAMLSAVLPRSLRGRADALAAPASRLSVAGPRLIEARRQRLAATERHLTALAPAHVLARGYSYTLDPAGRILRTVAGVAAGDRLTTVVSDGRVRSVVEGDAGSDGGGSRRPASLPAHRARPRATDDPGLFDDAGNSQPA